jgi:hypothetical protein
MALITHKLGLISFAIICYLNRLDIVALFWPGFYSLAIEKTDDPKLHARFYFALGEWDKRVEIDEKYGFISASLDYTYHGTQLHTEKMLDFLDFLDSIDSLIGVGKTELAMKYVQKYDPSTQIEQESIDRVIDILEYQEELMKEKKEYIEVAVDLLQDFKFAHDTDSHIYIRYFSFALLFQMCYLIHTWFLSNRTKNRFLFQMLIFFASSAWFIFYTSLPPLERFLTASTISTYGISVLLPPSDAAHRDNPSLERARQIFLKYPYNYEDLLTYQAMNLMSQVFWRELKRCNYPQTSNENELDSCLSAHKVGHEIATMIEVDESTKYFQHREFWYQDVRIALEEEVLNTVSTWPRPLFYVDSNIEPLQPDFIRTTMNDWLISILQDGNIDPALLPHRIQDRREHFSNGAESEL